MKPLLTRNAKLLMKPPKGIVSKKRREKKGGKNEPLGSSLRPNIKKHSRKKWRDKPKNLAGNMNPKLKNSSLTKGLKSKRSRRGDKGDGSRDLLLQ